jgi:hypothetical protein
LTSRRQVIAAMAGGAATLSEAKRSESSRRAGLDADADTTEKTKGAQS